jgi:PTS system galactitol-specific IIA component
MSFSGLRSSPSMIITDCDAKTDTEVIRLLSNLALEQGFIEELFIEKILEREKAYPTGLPTEVQIAIPHVSDGCIKSFFSVAVLREPVKFASMDGSDDPIMAQIVFLFGITNPTHQVKVLKKFCTIFQDSNLLRDCISIKDRKELLSMLKTALGDYIVL